MAFRATHLLKGGVGLGSLQSTMNTNTGVQTSRYVCTSPPMTLFLKPLNYLVLRSPDFPHTPPLFPNCFSCWGWVTRRIRNLRPPVAVLITRNRPTLLAGALLDQVTLEGVCFPLKGSLSPSTQASLSSPTPGTRDF